MSEPVDEWRHSSTEPFPHQKTLAVVQTTRSRESPLFVHGHRLTCQQWLRMRKRVAGKSRLLAGPIRSESVLMARDRNIALVRTAYHVEALERGVFASKRVIVLTMIPFF